MKILTVIGARPQFIKVAAVSRVLRQIDGLREVLVHTGQHFDQNMSEVFFRELEIPEPDYNLGISGGNHGVMTGRMLGALEEVMLAERPEWVLTYGDTNSTLAGALAAAKLHIPVAHVEAGLRSFNRRMPEEINRILTDHVSDLCFAPTETARTNLLREGIPDERIKLVGDVMYDAALYYGAKADRTSRILDQLRLERGGYVLATVHRAENTDDTARLQVIFEGLIQASEQLPIVLPLHPRTRQALVRENLFDRVVRRIRVIDPVGYLDMVMLEKNARLIATDSGGVQKEAFFYRVPCVTLRDETEWVELVELGWNRVVRPIDPGEICDAICGSTVQSAVPDAMPYGDGKAAERIVSELVSGGG